jgi:hypothetical protein
VSNTTDPAGAAGTRRRMRAGVAAVLAVAMGVAIVVAFTRLDRSAPDEPPVTWVEALGDRLAGTGGEITKELALDAFATLVAPIPGGTPMRVSPEPQSATFAIRGVLGHWQDLDDEQRQVVETQLLPAPGQATGQPGALPGQARAALVGGQPARVVAQPDGPLPLKLIAQVHVIAVDMGARYGLTYPPEIRVGWGREPASAIFGAAPVWEDPDGNERLVTSGDVPICKVLVFPKGLQLYERDPTGPEFTSAVAHELVHCYQYTFGPSVGPPWLVEGGAAWGGMLYAQERHGIRLDGVPFGPQLHAENWWRGYLDRPDRDLGTRSYDAVAFHSFIAAGAADPWRVYESMLRSPREAIAVAYRAMGQNPVDSRQRWATGAPRDAEFGPALTGPGLGTYRPTPTSVFLDVAGSEAWQVSGEAAVLHQLVLLGSEVDVIRVSATGPGAYLLRAPGAGGAGDPTPVLRSVPFRDGRDSDWYCLRERCECEDGTELSSDVVVVPGAGAVQVAATAGDRPAGAAVEAYALGDVCAFSPDEFGSQPGDAPHELPACEMLVSDAELRRLLPGADVYEFVAGADNVQSGDRIRTSCWWEAYSATWLRPPHYDEGWNAVLMLDVSHYLDDGAEGDDATDRCVEPAGEADLSRYGTLCVGPLDRTAISCNFMVHRVVHMGANTRVSVIVDSKDRDRELCSVPVLNYSRYSTDDMRDKAAQVALQVASRL